MSKKRFSEEFDKEVRRQYTVHQEAERLKAKIQQLDNANNPSTAGYLLRENHTLKPHDNTVIRMNLNRIEEAEKSSQQIEEIVKIDLESAVLSNGKIKADRGTSHRFDEDVTSVPIELKTKLATTKSKLTELGAKASDIFQVDYAPLKKKSRSKKQNKHRAAKSKAVRTSQRTSAVLQKIVPGLDKDSLCEMGHIQKEIVLEFKTKKKEMGRIIGIPK